MYDPRAYEIIADAYNCFRSRQSHDEEVIDMTVQEEQPQQQQQPVEQAPELKGGAHVMDAVDNLTAKFSFIDDVFETSSKKFKQQDDFDGIDDF